MKKVSNPISQESSPKTFGGLCLLALGYILLSFSYYGFTHLTQTSFDYNVPIAKSILSGDFLTLDVSDHYLYFPGSSLAILSLLMFFHIPINLFGVISWIFLFYVSKKIGDRFNLGKWLSYSYATAVVTTTTVIRTINDQSIDKWLCAWFGLSLYLLEKPEKTFRWSILLGASLGMLIGTKYSGPLFFVALALVYGTSFIRSTSILRTIVTLVSFSMTGLFWYIRNWILKGTPIYPANLPFLKGDPKFVQQDWMLWRVPIEYPGGILPLVNSFISEYLIWSFTGLVLIWYFYTLRKKKKAIDPTFKRITLLIVITSLVSLLLPVTPAYEIELFHIISDMRYILIVLSLSILAVFYIAKKRGYQNEITIITLLNLIPIFSFVPYYPKAFLTCLLVTIWGYLKREKLLHFIKSKKF